MAKMYSKRKHRRQLSVNALRPCFARQLPSRVAALHISVLMVCSQIVASLASVDRADRPAGVVAELQVQTCNVFANRLGGYSFRRCAFFGVRRNVRHGDEQRRCCFR